MAILLYSLLILTKLYSSYILRKLFVVFLLNEFFEAVELLKYTYFKMYFIFHINLYQKTRHG